MKNMAIWNDDLSQQEYVKKAFQQHLLEILKKHDSISFENLLKEMWHAYHHLTQYIHILENLKELEREGKIIIYNKTIYLISLTTLDDEGLKEIIPLESALDD